MPQLWIQRLLGRVQPQPAACPPRTPYFLFVGEAGSCLGGMQDYYGAYGALLSAVHAVPDDVDWAEVATVQEGSLAVVATGERDGRSWRWAYPLEAEDVSGPIGARAA